MCFGTQFVKDETPERAATLEALDLWRKHHWNYQHLLIEYNDLLKMKKDLGLKLEVIKRADLQDYPRSDFLSIKTEDEVMAYLLKSSLRQIHTIIGTVHRIVETSYTYRTLIAKCDDYAVQIRKTLNPPPKYLIKDLMVKSSSIRCHRTSTGGEYDYNYDAG